MRFPLEASWLPAFVLRPQGMTKVSPVLEKGLRNGGGRLRACVVPGLPDDMQQAGRVRPR